MVSSFMPKYPLIGYTFEHPSRRRSRDEIRAYYEGLSRRDLGRVQKALNRELNIALSVQPVD